MIKKDIFRITIGKRIALGFAFIIGISSAISIYTYSVLSGGIKRVNYISNTVEPSIEAINEFNFLIIETKMYAGNWVYQQSNEADKKKLKDIYELRAKQLKDKFGRYTQNWDIKHKQELETLYKEYEEILDLINSDIMIRLAGFEDYNNPIVTLEAADVLETQINPRSDELYNKLQTLSSLKISSSKELKDKMKSSFSTLGNIVLLLIFGLAMVAVGISLITNKSIVSNIYTLKDSIHMLMRGEIPEDVNVQTEDEIGEMAGAVNQLISGLKSYSQFAQEIGQGNFASSFNKLGENDALGNALIVMRNNLKIASDDEKSRAWTSEGITKISEILRINNESLEGLTAEAIKNLVKYMQINQGAIFLADDIENYRKAKLTMISCYAYGNLKHAYKEIPAGEGFVGQCWLEKEMIFITKVPDNYIRITSGLGESTPTSVLLCPLKINNQIFGVLELASFTVFTQVEINFVEKICEIIAATISNTRVAEKTQKLLEESKELTESLKSQEEELRQNHEEMMATQEEATRRYNETYQKLNATLEENENLLKEVENLKTQIEKLS